VSAPAGQPVHEFASQTALVTGASSGIGCAIAVALAARGAHVCVVGRNESKLATVAARCETHGVRVINRRADLVSEVDVAQIEADCRRTFGRLDILVHSAATMSIGRVADASVSDFDCLYQINLRAPYRLTQAMLPLLRSSKGQIVFINSTLALTSKGGFSQYAATKHGLKALADSLRDEVNADGVRVLSVYAGRTATPMQMTLHELEGRRYDADRLIQPDDIASIVLHALAAPRSIEITDIATRPLQAPR
jgi:short-subunit dehydrogenase